MTEQEKVQRASSEILARARYDSGMTANEVARKAGVNNMTIYKYELNKIPNMSLATLIKLANALGMDTAIFFEQVSALTQRMR